MITNEKFEEMIHTLLAYEEARNILKLSDKDRDEFQERMEEMMHPKKISMETPRGIVELEKDDETGSAYIGLKVKNETYIDLAQVNYLNEDNSADKDNYGEFCVFTFGDAMDEDYTDKKIVQNLAELENEIDLPNLFEEKE